MELVNQTPCPARTQVSNLEGTPFRYGLIVAKATFSVTSTGSTQLETQTPVPLFDTDNTTALGALPGDMVPRQDSAFEVILLGAAHSQRRSRCTVELAVGSHHRRLNVFGPRRWTTVEGRHEISRPLPFERVPLVWENAYGGTAECWLDARSPYDLTHPWNKYGKGFDALQFAQDLGKAFRAPPGYPRLRPDYVRDLPSCEHPDHGIVKWTDEPKPYCWATVPTDIGLHAHFANEHVRLRKQPLEQSDMLTQLYHRAHPDWILPLPTRDTRVTLRGATPKGQWSFTLPRLRIVADYVLGTRRGQRPLHPHMLVLLPEESRFYIVYRHFFTMKIEGDVERSFRLRLEEGWEP